MTTPSLLSLLLIGTTFVADFFSKSFPQKLRWIAFIAFTSFGALSVYLTASQYFHWASGSLVSRLLLPPHNSVNYFILYAFTEFWADRLIAVAIGLLGYLAIKRHAKQANPFFYPEEPLLCLLAFTFVGHPFWICYALTLLFAVFIGTLWTRFVTKTNNRIPFRNLWLPLAVLTVLISPFLNTFDFFIYLHL